MISGDMLLDVGREENVGDGNIRTAILFLTRHHQDKCFSGCLYLKAVVAVPI